MDLAPSWIETYPKHDLELLLRAAEYWEREALLFRANLMRDSENTWERVHAIHSADEEKARRIRAAVAAELERREPKTAEPIPSGIELQPAFLALFRNEAAARRAIDAAKKAEIIDEEGNYRHADKWPIVEFWQAVSERRFNLTFIQADYENRSKTYLKQCNAIAAQFGTTISRTAIYDAPGKDNGIYYSAVILALKG